MDAGVARQGKACKPKAAMSDCAPMKKKVSKAVSKYMSRIGATGGKAGKGSPARIAANRRTAQTRWRKLHPAPPEIISKINS